MRVPGRIPFLPLLLVPLLLGADRRKEPTRPLVPGPSSCLDCNGNGIDDAVDIAAGDSVDTNDNGVPDECEGLPVGPA